MPLNPASFGKLVRVIFPGIQTRRLGVRGESKYHYVDLALVDDEDETPAASNQTANSITAQDSTTLRRSTSTAPAIDFGTAPSLPADTAPFPSADLPFSERMTQPEEVHGPPSKARLFAYPDTRGMTNDTDGSLMYHQILRFPLKNETDLDSDDTIALPDIHPYCPPKTDNDTAEALVALYRTHCTSLVDCIRFCKEKQFFRLFTSFHGTLTVPVQKLFSHPNLAPWIRECDYLMYQKMVRFVSRLTLQAAPPIVITILNNISTNLHAHISKTFQTHATHVLEAKLQPAAIFASLLHRLIRVNAAAHAAANLLTVDHNREQMWREWVTMVNPKRVMEGSLPDCGYDEVYKVLTVDIRGLLEPLHSPPFPDNPMFECDNKAYASQDPTVTPIDKSVDGSISTENVLDRWSAFLLGLPSRFPQADTRTLLSCISAVGTAALRDITIMGGASYQTWWVMKIFVDEMTLWLAAMGGFLNRTGMGNTQTLPSASRLSPLIQAPNLRRPEGSLSSNATTSQSGGLDVDARSADTSGPTAQDDKARCEYASLCFPQLLTGGFAAARTLGHSDTTVEFNQDFGSFNEIDSSHHFMPSQSFEYDQNSGSMHAHQTKDQVAKLQMQAAMQPEIDDSGIGMGLTDDEMSRYGLTDLGNGAHNIGINVI